MNGIQEQIAIVACAHPQLFSWTDTFPGNWHYQCRSCGKGVTIPIMAILIEEDSKHTWHRYATRASRQRAVDIVGQAFGDKWQEQMQREADEWNKKEGIA